MYHFTVFIAVSLSLVAAIVVPRHTLPAGWHLESYTTYHVRYMALGCDMKHNTTFFDQCCHPLLDNQALPEARPAQCNPSIDDGDNNCYDDATTELSTPTSTTTPTTTPASTAHTPQNRAPTPNSAANTINTGGFATFFFQNGVAGACGNVHSDSDFIAAIDIARYGNTAVKSPLCGKQVSITNTQNNKRVVVVIADACPGCKNFNSIDLSQGAFEQIGPLSQGVLPILWSFV